MNASVDAQFRRPTAATPLAAVTKSGTTESPAMLIRMLPWNRIPNLSTGASSRQRNLKHGRHRVALHTIATLTDRAATAPATKLHSPAPASAAATATTLNTTVSAVSAIVNGR